jgi:hypothetical protein
MASTGSISARGCQGDNRRVNSEGESRLIWADRVPARIIGDWQAIALPENVPGVSHVQDDPHALFLRLACKEPGTHRLPLDDRGWQDLGSGL